MPPLNNFKNFPRAVKNQEVLEFEVEKNAVYLITITARCKNWRQNLKRLFNDDDLAVQIDDYFFAELSGKKYEFNGPGIWNGNAIKNTKKTVFFLLPLSAGMHKIKFWADGAPFVEEINIDSVTVKNKNIKFPSNVEFADLITKNISTEKIEVRNISGAAKEFELKDSGRTGFSFLLLDCQKKSPIESIRIKIGVVKNKLGNIKLHKDLTLSDEVNLRAEANQESAIIARIPDNKEVEIINEQVRGSYVAPYSNIWHEVQWQDRQGYVLSAFIEIQGQERQAIIDLIKTKCREQKAGANIMLAIAGQESRFKPFAASDRGPKGIFQLCKDAAKQVGVNDQFNFIENIEGGIKYYKWIEKQFTGRGNVLEKRLLAWHSGSSYIPAKGPVDYNRLPYPMEAKKFVKNVMENLKKRDWFHLVFLPLAILLATASLIYGILQNDFKKDGQNIVINMIQAQAAESDNRRKFIFYEYNIPEIIVSSIGTHETGFQTSFYYKDDSGYGAYREILGGYLLKAGWINNELFFIERERGKYYLPTAFYFFDELEHNFKKIKFIDRNGAAHDDISAPFDILSTQGEIILGEIQLETHPFAIPPVKKYKYNRNYLFEEI